MERAPAQGAPDGVTAPELQLSLDFALPDDIEVGDGTALFVSGTCFCPQAQVRSLELLVDGAAQPLSAHGMPRLDFFRALHPQLDPYATVGLDEDPGSTADPRLLGYRSGFWGTAAIGPVAGERVCVLRLRARLANGGEAVVELARIRAIDRAPAPDTGRFGDDGAGTERTPGSDGAATVPTEGSDGAATVPTPGSGGTGTAPRVAICMATHNPPADLLALQIESIRAQTVEAWVCFISDDCSGEEGFATLLRTVDHDPRFVVSRSPRRLGFYRNFERALRMVPARAGFVAMADQDDFWHPDKLETLLARIGDAQLVYSDARIVARDGTLLSDTYWSERRNNHSDLTSLLVANAVTGAASLLRRELLDVALPFPPAQFAHYHDHWIGLTALALGEIAFVERPLYDYVQHGEASLGHAAANRMTALRDRLANQRAPRERVRAWRLHYFVDACRLLQIAAILRMRCGSRMTASKRRSLERFLAADRSLLPLARLGARGARELLGRPETLGAEWMLFHAFAWRRLLGLTVRKRPQTRLRFDAVPPPSLALAPARDGLDGTVREVADKLAPLELARAEDAPRRINILIPTIDIEHFFGGYIAKLNLARRLAERGLRVRIVTVDPVGALPPGWRRTLESYSGLEGLFDRVEVAFGRRPDALEVSPSDGFVATTWWTAHIAADAVRALGNARFVYLIQEYEPFTFPMGTYAALAAQSYRHPHFALYSSELLREYFRRHAIGVFAGGEGAGERASASFQNAITPVRAPTAAELGERSSRRLLFYARPEEHAARNMFELGVLALSRAARDGVFQRGWELLGIGSIAPGRRIALGGGATLTVQPRSDQAAYGELLREHDVGLALMYTPHPSLVPIEMASAGMLTVTNSFECKTPQALSAISSNLITAEPSVDGVAAALQEAVTGVEDHERRARGSAVRWSCDWDDSFDEALLNRVVEALR
jgi:glycosyltransferase involved in cell wall biosynthesis